MSFIEIEVRNTLEPCRINLLIKDSIFKKSFLNKINLKFLECFVYTKTKTNHNGSHCCKVSNESNHVQSNFPSTHYLTSEPSRSTIEQVLHLLSNISIIMRFHRVFISGSNIILCDFLHRNYKRAKYNNSYNPIRKLNNGDKNPPKTYK